MSVAGYIRWIYFVETRKWMSREEAIGSAMASESALDYLIKDRQRLKEAKQKAKLNH